MARWEATEPACARVVPSAERRIVGGGERVVSCVGQLVLSALVMASSFVAEAAGGGARRESVVMVLMEGCVRSVERISEPWVLRGVG